MTRLTRHAPVILVAALCVAVLALAGSTGFAGPLNAFHAQGPGQPLLFGLRVGLLIAASWVCVEQRAWRTLALVAIAFVASLAARGMLVALIAVALYALYALGGARRWAGVALLAASIVPCTALGQAPRHEPWPEHPAALVAHFSARGNLWRARYAALAWARSENAAPGEGYLTLAKIDQKLGQHGKAARVLAKLRARGRTPGLRARAVELIRRWHLEAANDGR